MSIIISLSVYGGAVFLRSHAGLLLEEAREMVRIFEAEFVCHSRDIALFFRQQDFGKLYKMAVQVFLRRLAGLPLYEVAEIVRRQTHLAGASLHCRNSVLALHAVMEIVVKVCVEAVYNAVVVDFARNELPLIKRSLWSSSVSMREHTIFLVWRSMFISSSEVMSLKHLSTTLFSLSDI